MFRHLFSFCLAIALSVVSSPTQAATVLNYNFDGNLLDTSGNSKHGTFVGGIPSYVTGDSGNAIALNGSSQYVVMPNGIISGQTNFTITIRFRVQSGNKGVMLAYQNGAATTTSTNFIPIAAVDADGKFRAELWTGASLVLTSTSRVDDGVWHTAVITGDLLNGTLDVYLDGSSVGTTAGTIVHLDMYYNQIGYVPSNVGPRFLINYFHGDIDNLGITNTATPIDVTPPTINISAAEVTDGGSSGSTSLSLTFTVSEATSNFSATDITVNNGSLSNFSASSDTVYTATLSPTTYGAVTIDVAANTFNDAIGNGNTAATQFNWTYLDQIAPTIAFSPVGGATGVAANSNITLTASEAIRLLNNTALDDTNVDALITLKATDATGVDIPFDATISGNVITINPTSDFSSLQQVYVAIGSTVEDSSDNALAAVNATFTAANSDITAPSTSTATIASSGTTVTLGMSETLNASSVPAGSAFVVTIDGVAVTPTAVSISGSNVSLTMATAIESGSTVSVTYTKPASGSVLEDVAGNDMASFDTAGSITPTNNSTIPNSPPTTSTASIDSLGTTVTMGMSETLNASSVPAAASFAVTVDGSAITPTSVGISGSSVALTMATAIGSGSTVSVAYTKPASGSVLEDVAGNDMASFDTAGSITPTNNSALDTIAPSVVITGPAGVVISDFTVTMTFSETVTGFDATDVVVVNGTKGTFSGSNAIYTLVVSPQLGTTVSIAIAANTANDAATNGNLASNTLQVSTGSPASEFATNQSNIKATLTADAMRSLTSSMASTQLLAEQARDRLISDLENNNTVSGRLSTRNYMPFDVDGSLDISGGTLSTSGKFFEQTGNFEGTKRRLFFGDFDAQHNGDTGSTTATLTARLAWETMASEQTLVGYFVGGEFAQSKISDTFTGDQTRAAATVGGYAVKSLGQQLYLDGYISFSLGNNALEMSNNVLTLDSDYTTRSTALGFALTGVYALEYYELRPELAFNYGKTWIGDVGFTGTAYGVTDNTLSLDAGNVSVANLTLRPEMIFTLDAQAALASQPKLSFAPRFICQRIVDLASSEDCGGGGEIGLSKRSNDSLSSAEFRIIIDRIGGTTHSSGTFNLQHRF